MGKTPDPSMKEQDLVELRAESLSKMILLTAAVGLIFLWLLIYPLTGESAPLTAWAGLWILLLSSLGSFVLKDRLQGVSSSLLLLGVLTAVTSAILIFRLPDLAYFYALVVIFAGVLLGTTALLLMTILAGSILLAISTIQLSLPLLSTDVLLPMALILLVYIASRLSVHNLVKALAWALNAYQRSLRNLQLLRERRAELRRTLNALEEATGRIERANRELAIARREADEARILKEQFVANVSHELRTPLNIIVGFAEMMYLSPESYEDVFWTPDLESDIQEMYRASRHLESLVNDVLDLSRIDSARLPMFRELVDIRNILVDAGETIAPLLRQHGLYYEVECPNALPYLLVDRTRIRQVMLNLLNNAVRYTDAGGITTRAEQMDDAVQISVHDTGVGIPENQLDQIFEEFVQVGAGRRGRGGTGLGLALCRQFVELHGGRMWVESEVGMGSTFYFSLPLPGALPQVTPLHSTPFHHQVKTSDGAVVVVDPDPTIAEMLSRYLGDRPVLPASGPSEAEAEIEAGHPLAVIVNLPPDAPRDAWLGALGENSERYSVPIIRCSIPSPSWLRQTTSIDDCLTKPISRNSLRQTLVKHCPEPTTLMVVDDDPNRSGVKDTWGRLLYTTIRADEDIFQAFGVGAGTHHEGPWSRRGDRIELDWVQPKMKEALVYMRQVWADGLFHPDSITIPMGQRLSTYDAGTTGNAHVGYDGHDAQNTKFKDLGPEAYQVLGEPLKGPKGHQGVTGRGFPWGYVVSESCETPEDVIRILDYIFSPEIVGTLICEGVNGITNKGLNEKGWVDEFTTEESLAMGDEWKERQARATGIGLWTGIHQGALRPWLLRTFPDDMRKHFESVLARRYSPEALKGMEYCLKYTINSAKAHPVPADIEYWGILQSRFGEFISQIVAGTLDADSGWEEWLKFCEENGLPEITKQVNEG